MVEMLALEVKLQCETDQRVQRMVRIYKNYVYRAVFAIHCTGDHKF